MENEKSAFDKMGADEKKLFCKYWPTAKDLLTIIAKVMPGENVKKVIDEIIKWGDRAYKLCPVVPISEQ